MFFGPLEPNPLFDVLERMPRFVGVPIAVVATLTVLGICIVREATTTGFSAGVMDRARGRVFDWVFGDLSKAVR